MSSEFPGRWVGHAKEELSIVTILIVTIDTVIITIVITTIVIIITGIHRRSCPRFHRDVRSVCWFQS